MVASNVPANAGHVWDMKQSSRVHKGMHISKAPHSVKRLLSMMHKEHVGVNNAVS